MGDFKLIFELDSEELQILLNAISSSIPSNKDDEAKIFKLYYKLRLKLGEKTV